MAIEDYVQAEYTIDSVLKNYKVTTDGILEEAQRVKDELMQIKSQGKTIDLNANETIEIGGGND
jgi:hypothetical protein